MAKTGRKLKKINFKRFENMAKEHYNQKTIAKILHISTDTLADRVRTHYGMDYEDAVAELQYESEKELIEGAVELAKKNPAMAIFLLKVWLKWNPDLMEAEREEPTEAEKALLEVLKGAKK